MRQELEDIKEALWTAYHADELSRIYSWDQLHRGLPLFVAEPLEFWYVWAMLAFGVVCSIYIPFFWVVYALGVAFLVFMTILGLAVFRPHSLYGMVRRTYWVSYKDGTERTVVMQFPRWACQYETDPYGTMHYKLPELSNNSKVNSYIGTFPSYHSNYI